MRPIKLMWLRSCLCAMFGHSWILYDQLNVMLCKCCDSMEIL